MDVDTLPPMPEWLLDSPLPSSFLDVPDCPCCLEPDPELSSVSESVRWAIPGVWQEPVPATPPVASPPLLALSAALGQLEGLDPTDLSGEQALLDLDVLLACEQQLRRHKLQALADARSRKHYLLDDAPSLPSWTRRRHPDSLVADVTLADHLRRFPVLRQQALSGELPVAVSRRVVQALRKAAPHLDRPDGLIDGQPAGPVINAVVANTLDLIAQAVMGFLDDDPLPDLLRAQIQQIMASGDSELGTLEQAFVLLASHLHPDHLAGALSQQLDALLPLQLEERNDRVEDHRDLTLTPHPDRPGGRVEGDADAELWELLHTLLAAAARRDPSNPEDTQAAADLRNQSGHTDATQTPDTPTHLDDRGQLDQAIAEQVEQDWDLHDGAQRPRSKGQRLHDAFKQLLQRHLDAGLAGSHDKTPVTLNVLVRTSRLDDHPGALPAMGGSGQTLPASLLRRWWCNSKVTAFLLSPRFIPIGASHGQRTLTALERTAARVRDGGCAGHGCCRPNDPLTELVPHHVQPWATHRNTSLADSVLACPRLHHDLHHGKTVQARNGRWLNEHGWTSSPDH